MVVRFVIDMTNRTIFQKYCETLTFNRNNENEFSLSSYIKRKKAKSCLKLVNYGSNRDYISFFYKKTFEGI